jgi:uncharacterized protein YegL
LGILINKAKYIYCCILFNFFQRIDKKMALLVEFAENQEPRCPVILLCDTSGSMSGESINALNSGLATFKNEVCKDEIASLRVEVAIVTFDSKVKLLQNFVTIDDFAVPLLEADGVTLMGEAIEFSLDLLEKRKTTYKEQGIQYYRPWVFLITDGAPSDSWENAALMVREAEEQRRLSFFAVGVEDADLNKLKQIAPPQRPPLKLNGLNFKEMFVWLSASMKRVSCIKIGDEAMVALPPVGWGSMNI